MLANVAAAENCISAIANGSVGYLKKEMNGVKWHVEMAG